MAGSQRRTFLKQSAAAGALATVGDFGFLHQLPHLGAAQVEGAARALARLEPDIDPLVRLIEDTARERVIEAVVERIRGGTSYQELLSAIMLAGVRGIQPRPVGFKFHAVLVVNSAHLASLASADRDRWLPLLWAVDNFKASQARNRTEGDWRMAPATEQLPPAHEAPRRFREAMGNWEVEAADRAITSWARAGSLNDVYEAFWLLGARDFRNIGHKAIYVANSYRTLGTIGWRHAEPILRSLAYALLEHEGTNPAQRDAAQDRPGRDNLQRLTRIRAAWQRGRVTREAAADFLATLRIATPGDASGRVVELLNDQVDPACIWDGLFGCAGELLMQQPGIVGLHCVTCTNALYFGYLTSARDETRRYLMLQAAAFLPMFREAMANRGQRLQERRLDTLEPLEVRARGAAAIEEVFTEVSRDRLAGARKMLGVLQADGQGAEPMMAAARRLVVSRGNDSHDYKFSAAALEDFYHVTPAWRNRFLATAAFYLKGSGGQDTDLVQRLRAALARPGR